MATSFTKGNRPDITPAQIIGLLIGGIPVLAGLTQAFLGIDLSKEQTDALEKVITFGGVVAGTLFGADAFLRGKRNEADALVKATAISSEAEPVEIPDEGDIDDGDLPTDKEELADLPDGVDPAIVQPSQAEPTGSQ